MTLKARTPSLQQFKLLFRRKKKKKREHVKNLNKKNLLRTMHTSGSVIKALHYYSVLFTMHSSGFIANTWA